jgi:hypothetical protein
MTKIKALRSFGDANQTLLNPNFQPSAPNRLVFHLQLESENLRCRFRIRIFVTMDQIQTTTDTSPKNIRRLPLSIRLLVIRLAVKIHFQDLRQNYKKQLRWKIVRHFEDFSASVNLDLNNNLREDLQSPTHDT